MQNNTYALTNRSGDRPLKLIQMLVLSALGGVLVAVPVSARSAEAPNTKTGRTPRYRSRYERRSDSRCHSTPSRAGRGSARRW